MKRTQALALITALRATEPVGLLKPNLQVARMQWQMTARAVANALMPDARRRVQVLSKSGVRP